MHQVDRIPADQERSDRSILERYKTFSRGAISWCARLRRSIPIEHDRGG
jgi:hypothetical protein